MVSTFYHELGHALIDVLQLPVLGREEVAVLNKTYGLPEAVSVGVEPCGEANAFYDPTAKRITICTEYAEDMARVWQSVN